MDSLKRVLRLLGPYRKKMTIGYVLVVIAMGLRVIAPYITASVVNNVLPGRDMHLLLRLCALLVGVTAVRGVLIYRRGLLFEDISQSVVYDLRTTLYRHMQDLPSSFYDHHHIGEIMSRMTGDIEGVRVLVINGGLSLVENVLMFLFSTVGMFLMSWQLGLIMMTLCPFIAFAAWKFNRKIRPAFTAIREQNAVLNTRTQENISGVRVVKAFAREEHEKEAFSVDNLKVRDANLNVTRIWSTYYPLLDTIASMATPVLLIAGSFLTITGKLSIGMLVGATGYVWMIVAPMRQVASFVNIVTNGLVSSEKLFYYLDFGSRITNPPEPREPGQRLGRVDFNHVSFKYDDTPVLEDIDLHVEPGQSVAVVGATGSGKTTLISLIRRAYDVSGGSVSVDGVDVREQDLHALRATIGTVMQETFLFSESILNNIRFGHSDASEEAVRRAAEIAQADEFIRDMPQGYDTIVGERGLGLSGGQKQRVALARAILYDPKILIMDDATSAVDMETEAEIQEALRSVMKGRTTFIIAHRISSVRRADLIVCLDNGKIAERGTHAELLAAGGLYAQMYADQTRDFAGGEN